MDRNEVNRIALDGDLSMVGIKEGFQILERHVVSRAEVAAEGGGQNVPLEIDLTGVKELDACGCQLLAVFLNNLRRHGAAVCSVKLNEACRMKIHNLGFDDEIFNGECP